MPKIKNFNCYRNAKIYSVNHLADLEILGARQSCGINQQGIQDCLRLKNFDCYGNSKINSVNHLTNLEILDAGGNCGIDQNVIQYCMKLKKLYCDANSKINFAPINYYCSLTESN